MLAHRTVHYVTYLVYQQQLFITASCLAENNRGQTAKPDGDARSTMNGTEDASEREGRRIVAPFDFVGGSDQCSSYCRESCGDAAVLPNCIVTSSYNIVHGLSCAGFESMSIGRSRERVQGVSRAITP